MPKISDKKAEPNGHAKAHPASKLLRDEISEALSEVNRIAKALGADGKVRATARSLIEELAKRDGAKEENPTRLAAAAIYLGYVKKQREETGQKRIYIEKSQHEVARAAGLQEEHLKWTKQMLIVALDLEFAGEGQRRVALRYV